MADIISQQSADVLHHDVIPYRQRSRIAGVSKDMKMRTFQRLAAALSFTVLGLVSCAHDTSTAFHQAIGQSEFDALLNTVARGWNTNDARLAASAFADDAIYAEPPTKQLYVGRDEIFEFFGGTSGRSDWMKIVWHNVSFNPERQVGAGEFTFSWLGGQVHGMVSIKVQNGLISRWREYFYESDLTWQDFQRPSEF